MTETAILNTLRKVFGEPKVENGKHHFENADGMVEYCSCGYVMFADVKLEVGSENFDNEFVKLFGR